jgi:uncharacterized protein (DUF433 family)
MSALPTTVDVPLVTDPDGTIRVRGTRVTLDSVIVEFCAGATAEEIKQQFPAVSLADIYQVIAHYLNHTAEINAYVSQRQVEASALKSEIETRFDPVGVRDRLLARRKAADAT